MYSYIMGTSSQTDWIGFAKMREADDRNDRSASVFSSPEAPEYYDSSGRKWSLLSAPYDSSGCGGLLAIDAGTKLVSRRRKATSVSGTIAMEGGITCSTNSCAVVSLDPVYTDQGYTAELYESACHIMGTSATWRVNTKGGYHRVRLHLVDWWHWPAKTSGAPRMFQLCLHADGESQKHTICSPSKGFAKVEEFLVHISPVTGQLDIEVRSDSNSDSALPACFSGFEVLQVPREDLVPNEHRNRLKDVATEDLKQVLDCIPAPPRQRERKQKRRSVWPSWLNSSNKPQE